MRSSVLFLGWLIGQRKVEELRKTRITYLPLIDMKVTYFKTIIMYLENLQALANSVNMKYVNITQCFKGYYQIVLKELIAAPQSSVFLCSFL